MLNDIILVQKLTNKITHSLNEMQLNCGIDILHWKNWHSKKWYACSLAQCL